VTRGLRRRRFGEWGQGFLEFVALGALLIIPAVVVLGVGGGWAAATYDQHHSSTPLTSKETATETPEPPSIVFVDFSPVGLNEACILKAAANSGLTWDGGELGWSAGSNPRPQHSDPNYDAKLRSWRAKMTGLLTAAQESKDWQACLKPEFTPPPQRTQEPAETIAVDGTYTIDPDSVQAIGGCGSDVPTTLTVSGGGAKDTVVLGGKGIDLIGNVNTSTYSLIAANNQANGSNRTLRGSFSANAGVTRFTGIYEITDNTAGCGYNFTAEKR
jgi:hypothetical protein